jgi:hypothetical protein
MYFTRQRFQAGGIEVIDMDNNDIEDKRAKALRYATEPERFSLISLSVVMNSHHGIRQIQFADGSWRCVCEFYLEHSTCSHILAVQEMLKKGGLCA